MRIEEVAPAKVNLMLRVTGRRADGYHLLHSLVVFAGAAGDRLVIEPAPELSLALRGPFAPGVPVDEGNLVLRAARRLGDLRRTGQGARITLEKNLPHGAGIGGGSADAAAAIRGLARLWGVPPLSGAEALPLGADVPVCLHAPRPMFMEGIGEVLRPAPALPPLHLVLVNPGVAVPTGAVFAALDGGCSVPPSQDDLGPAPDARQLAAWLRRQGNDLTKVAMRDGIAPAIAKVLDALSAQPGCLACQMSGSGSTCWGLFDDAAAAEKAAARIAGDQPEWWVRATPIARPDQAMRATT